MNVNESVEVKKWKIKLFIMMVVYKLMNENNTNSVAIANEPFEITDEIRKSISGNPFVIE